MPPLNDPVAVARLRQAVAARHALEATRAAAERAKQARARSREDGGPRTEPEARASARLLCVPCCRPPWPCASAGRVRAEELSQLVAARRGGVWSSAPFGVWWSLVDTDVAAHLFPPFRGFFSRRLSTLLYLCTAIAGACARALSRAAPAAAAAAAAVQACLRTRAKRGTPNGCTGNTLPQRLHHQPHRR
eukprot:6207809-Pleurochrysis_carterae.AAC.2